MREEKTKTARTVNPHKDLISRLWGINDPDLNPLRADDRGFNVKTVPAQQACHDLHTQNTYTERLNILIYVFVHIGLILFYHDIFLSRPARYETHFWIQSHQHNTGSERSPSRCESSSYCRKHGPFFLKKVICIDLYRDSFYCCIDWCDTYPYISRVFCAKVFKSIGHVHIHTWMLIIIITETNSPASAPLVNIKTNDRDGTGCVWPQIAASSVGGALDKGTALFRTAGGAGRGHNTELCFQTLVSRLHRELSSNTASDWSETLWNSTWHWVEV